MLLNLTKLKPVMAIPSVPTLPTPPLVRLVNEHGAPVTPKPPKEPSRFWCFFGVHKFVIQDESSWKRTDERDRVVAKGPMYVLRCTVCGKVKAECL